MEERKREVNDMNRASLSLSSLCHLFHHLPRLVRSTFGSTARFVPLPSCLRPPTEEVRGEWSEPKSETDEG